MADVRIGGAYVDWTARNQQFLAAARRNGAALRAQQERVRQLRRTVRDFNQTATEQVRRLTSIRGAVVALAGAGGLGLLVRRTVAQTAEIEDLARQAGASVEAFQELTFVSRAYGVSQDALVDGIKELNLRFDEFVQTGQGPAQEAIRRLGFNAVDLSEALRDSSALFDEVIRRTQQLDTAARIRVADELFGGTAGEQFVRIIEAGAQGVAQMRREARELGLVFDAELVGRTRDLQRQIDILEAQFSGQLSRAIVENADALQDLGNQLVDLVPQVAQFADSVVSGFRYVVENAATIVEVFAAVQGARAGFAIGRLAGPVAGGLGAAGGAVLASVAANEALRQVQNQTLQLSAVTADIEAVEARLRALGNAVGGPGGFVAQRSALEAQLRELRDLQATLATVPEPRQQLAAVVNDIAILESRLRDLRRLQQSVADFPDEVIRLTVATNITEAEAELRRLQELRQSLLPQRPGLQASDEAASRLLFANFGSPLSLINPDLLTTVGHLTEITNQTRLFDEALAEIPDQIQITTETLEEWPGAVERTSLALESAIRLSAGLGASVGSFVADLTTGVDSLSDSIRNLAREITNLLRTELIARPIAEGIQRFLLGEAGFLGLAGIGRAQAGGLHRGLTLVGEQGPELVNLGRQSRVTPAGETDRLLGGDTYNLGGISIVGENAEFIEQVFRARVLPEMYGVIRAAQAERGRG